MRPRASRRRQALGWLAWVGAGWALAGPAVGVACCAVAAWHLLRPPPPGVLIRISAGLLALVPAAWIVGNGGRLGEVSPDLVLANRVPGLVAAAALALLVTGVWRDVIRALPTDRPPREEEAP